MGVKRCSTLTPLLDLRKFWFCVVQRIRVLLAVHTQANIDVSGSSERPQLRKDQNVTTSVKLLSSGRCSNDDDDDEDGDDAPSWQWCCLLFLVTQCTDVPGHPALSDTSQHFLLLC